MWLAVLPSSQDCVGWWWFFFPLFSPDWGIAFIFSNEKNSFKKLNSVETLTSSYHNSTGWQGAETKGHVFCPFAPQPLGQCLSPLQSHPDTGCAASLVGFVGYGLPESRSCQAAPERDSSTVVTMAALILWKSPRWLWYTCKLAASWPLPKWFFLLGKFVS